MSLVGTVQASVNVTLSKQLDLSNVSSAIAGANGLKQWLITSGVGVDEADEVFHDERTLAQSASEELDLSGGLTNALGDSIVFARVKCIHIVSASADNTANLLIGGAAANGFSTFMADPSDRMILRGGNSAGVMLFTGDAIGYVVTAGAGDLLKLEHDGSSGNSFIYRIILIGATA